MFRRAKLGLGSAMGFDIPLKLNCLQIAQFILMIATYLPPSFLPLFNSDNKTAAESETTQPNNQTKAE